MITEVPRFYPGNPLFAEVVNAGFTEQGRRTSMERELPEMISGIEALFAPSAKADEALTYIIPLRGTYESTTTVGVRRHTDDLKFDEDSNVEYVIDVSTHLSEAVFTKSGQEFSAFIRIKDAERKNSQITAASIAAFNYSELSRKMTPEEFNDYGGLVDILKQLKPIQQ